MIRLRIGKEVKTFSKEGLIWYKGGRPYQVIIEESRFVEKPEQANEAWEVFETEWVPVEVNECPTE